MRTDDKKAARLNVMRDALSRLHYMGKNDKPIAPDTRVVFKFDEACLAKGLLAP